MKTLSLVSMVFFLNACTVDTFGNTPDSGNTDAGPTQDGDAGPVTEDGGPDQDGATQDSGPGQDGATTNDAQADSSSDAGPDTGTTPMCAPLGYKACVSGSATKCAVTAADGTAQCRVPGTKVAGQGCTTDDDCGNDAVCEVNLCRNLCQKTFSTPWGTNNTTWNLKGCGVCPNSGTHFLDPRFPSWIGVCTY